MHQYTGNHLPAGIELQERGALRHGVKGILDILEGPAGPVAHLACRAEQRIDRHGPEGRVKSPVHLGGLQRSLQHAVPAQVRVVLDVRPQVLQIALLDRLIVGDPCQVDDVGDLPGGHL